MADPFAAGDTPPIKIEYEGRTLHAHRGDRLLDVVLEAGIDHRHVCGGNGFCTSCRIELLDGFDSVSPVSALERDRLGPDAGRLRLACQTTVHGPICLRVPPPAPSRFGPDDDD